MSAVMPDPIDRQRTEAEIDKLLAETRKLLSESSKYQAEQGKLTAEILKLNRERAWYPLAIGAAVTAGVGGVLTAIFTLILRLNGHP